MTDEERAELRRLAARDAGAARIEAVEALAREPDLRLDHAIDARDLGYREGYNDACRDLRARLGISDGS